MTYIFENDRYQLSIVYVDSCLKVDIEGDIDLEDSYSIWQKIIEKGNYFSCKRIFIQSNLKDMDRIHAFKYKDLFDELRTPWTFRIAWMEDNPENRDNIKFLDRVINYWGLKNINYFENKGPAMNWLLESRKLTGSY